MMMMRRMIVVVHAWCLRIEPVRGLAFTSLSLRACTLAPLSTSLITDCAKLFDWSAMTNCFTGIAIWKTACCIVWGKCKMQQKVFVKTVWETRLSKIVWGIAWNYLRQYYEEVFSAKLVTNYFQWTRSALWQMFHWSNDHYSEGPHEAQMVSCHC